MGLGPDGERRGGGELAEGGHDDGVVVESGSCKDADGGDGDDFCRQEDVGAAGERSELVWDRHISFEMICC